MLKPKKIFIIVILSIPLGLSSCTAFIEKPKYTVIQKEGNFEIRQYEPYLIAETEVDSQFDQAGNIAFSRLFNYIQGENKTQKTISMTAPVNQESRSAKISMTAPVNQQRSGNKYAVSFVMPSKYTMETLPVPLDPAVIIKEIPAQKAAVIRYTGTWDQKLYEEKKASLQDFIQQEKLTKTGEPTFARYNPPFTIWFLRRNEVIIPVE